MIPLTRLRVAAIFQLERLFFSLGESCIHATLGRRCIRAYQTAVRSTCTDDYDVFLIEADKVRLYIPLNSAVHTELGRMHRQITQLKQQANQTTP